MKNPDPNEVAILTDLLGLQRSRFASLPGLHSLIPVIHPVIFYDDASGTFQYTVTGTGADFTADYVTDAAFIHVNGIHLQTKTTTPAAADNVYADIFLPLGPGPIVRLQLLFRRPAGLSTHYTTVFRLIADNETNSLIAMLEAHWQSAKLAYHKKTNGAWSMTELADSFLQPDDAQWHKLDVSINVLTHEWVAIKLNGKSLAIASPELEPGVALGRGRRLAFRLGVLAAANAQAENHFDQVLITTQEA